MSGEKSTFRRFVEVGRIVVLKSGPSAGKIAAIVEIIDHNRAIVDGPLTGVPRQAFPYRHLALTKFKVSKLPRAAGSGVVAKRFEADKIVEKWTSSPMAKKQDAADQRRKLNDFERFSVMLARKRRRDAARISLAKAKKA